MDPTDEQYPGIVASVKKQIQKGAFRAPPTGDPWEFKMGTSWSIKPEGGVVITARVNPGDINVMGSFL